MIYEILEIVSDSLKHFLWSEDVILRYADHFGSSRKHTGRKVTAFVFSGYTQGVLQVMSCIPKLIEEIPQYLPQLPGSEHTLTDSAA